MTPGTTSLSIIIPVYNERTLLANAVAALGRFLAANFADWEIILVESGSTDGTAELCDSIAAGSTRFRVVHEGGRNGFGSALKLGFRAATKDLVLMTTADEPFPITAVLDALPLLDQYDCVLSYRSEDYRASRFRKFQSKVYNAIVRLALGVSVRHVNSAFKLYKRSLIQSFELLSNGWFVDAEIVYWITKQRIPYAEIPVPLLERACGQSTVSLTTAFSLLRELRTFLIARRAIQVSRDYPAG